MENQISKMTIISSLFWKFLEIAGVQGISFIISIILARLLSPSEYGIISLVSIFISIAIVIVQEGFSTALIQSKNSDNTDYSSVCYFSIFFGVVIYFLLFLLAPRIAIFFDEPILTNVLRVLALILFPGAYNSVQLAIVYKTLEFKKLFKSSLLATIISGTIGVAMAYFGFGVWSLVIQQLINKFIVVIVMHFTLGWKPKFIFSFKRIKGLLSYGWKILASSLLTNIFINIRGLLIGKMYLSSSLAFYNRGKQFPELILMNIGTTLQSVMLPVFSKEQDDRVRVKNLVRKSMGFAAFFSFPMMFGLAVIAEPFVKIVLTDKWLPCVPYLQIFCFIYMLYPLTSINLQAIKALGYSGVILKLDILRKTIEIIILIITIRNGVWYTAVGALVSTIIGTIINMYPNTKILEYSYSEQIADILQPLVLSTLMLAVIIMAGKIIPGVLMRLLLQILLGLFFYTGAAILSKNKEMYLIILTLKSKRH